eukprot:gene1329-2558_t
MNEDDANESVDDVIRIRRANDTANQIVSCHLHEGLATPTGQMFALLSNKASNLSESRKFEIFSLLENNMRAHYEKAWGWDKEGKWKEMFAINSHYLLVLDNSLDGGDLVGFVHYQFTWDDEDEPEFPVLFCFELQLDIKYQKLGIGRELMSMLTTIASHWHMNKTMLTCFKSNIEAMQFYRKIGFNIDKNSPSKYEASQLPLYDVCMSIDFSSVPEASQLPLYDRIVNCLYMPQPPRPHYASIGLIISVPAASQRILLYSQLLKMGYLSDFHPSMLVCFFPRCVFFRIPPGISRISPFIDPSALFSVIIVSSLVPLLTYIVFIALMSLRNFTMTLQLYAGYNRKIILVTLLLRQQIKRQRFPRANSGLFPQEFLINSGHLINPTHFFLIRS